MKDRLSVFVNGRCVMIPRGMRVKHALIAYDEKVYKACTEGRISVETEDGFGVGLDGAVEDGARLRTKPVAD